MNTLPSRIFCSKYSDCEAPISVITEILSENDPIKFENISNAFKALGFTKVKDLAQTTLGRASSIKLSGDSLRLLYKALEMYDKHLVSDMVNTLKRQMNNMNTNNTEIIDLNDEDADVTWGGLRSRYLYNYTLECNDLISDTNDSNDSESVHSVQSKTTMEAISEADLSSDCGSDCECVNRIRETEFDVLSTSSSCLNMESSSSDSSTLIDFKVTKSIINCDNTYLDKTILTDNGYCADDTDGQIASSSKTTLPPPACFKNCLQCHNKNPNPYFQYCFVCFRYRMEFFGNKPRSKTKNVKRLNTSKPRKESTLLGDFQESNQLNSLQDDSTQTKNIENSINLVNDENINNICNICLKMPKNGVFNHGKIGHIYCCYSCAKKIWKKSNKCPICKLKIKFVTKMIIV